MTRTRIIGTRVTEVEYQQLRACAGKQPMSDYVRGVLLKPEAANIVLEEVLALRMIVLNLSNEPRDKVTSVMQQADAAKRQATIEVLRAG